MQLPQININGTEKHDLFGDYMVAKRALDNAIDAVSAAWPHGRDYQTLPAGAAQQAMNEHAERLVKLRTVRAEIETILEHLV